jgi:predicted kinase
MRYTAHLPTGQAAMGAKLFFMCGKMAAGKSTLARDLARRENAILLVQDEWLEALFPGEIVEIPDYVARSRRLNAALAPHVCALLARGVSVVLDFPANTVGQRAWFRRLIDGANVEHEMHYVDAPDVVCKRQLLERSRHLPSGTPWTTEAEFETVTRLFEAPSDAEGFTIVHHRRSVDDSPRR